jgi:pimeloyl-ACP methyl ester carboxylesterase
LDALAVDAHGVAEKLPQDVVVRDPRSGASKHVWLTQRLFEETVRSALYSRELVALLPRLFSEKDFAGFAALALQQRNTLERTINPYIYFSVVCREDIPFAHEPETAGFFVPHLEALRAICSFWPVSADAMPRVAVVSDVRTLLISGEHDPVTPPSEAARVAKTLKQSTQLVLKNEGHINVYRGCVPHLLGEFVDHTTPLDTSCVERAAALPLFTGANGP